MNPHPLDGLDEIVAALHSAWATGDSQDIAGLGRSALVAVNDALGSVRRRLEAVHAQVAAEIARESRPELGSDSLAKQQGFRNPAALIAASTGSTGGDASRLVQVGQATAPRMTLTGESAPAKHPHVAAALQAGTIGAAASSAIITMLDRVALRAGADAVDTAERTLTAQAPGLTLDQLGKLVVRAEAWLDPDGLEPKEIERRGNRSLTMRERDGMVLLTASLDVETAAPVKAAIEAIVTAEFRRDVPAGADHERRSVVQVQADALAMLARHALGCTHSDLPLDDTTVIVRVSLDDLRNGAGVAQIDGLAQPISIGAARRIAASAGVIPCVLDAGTEILDWGREKRLFTKAQKLALVERDGGCAMCGLEPGKTRAHHRFWWSRDAGPTNLNNGVLLCESCHHRIHDNGWDIRIEGRGSGARVWFIPPPHVDPSQAPRLGGRARYDFAA